MPVSRTSRRGKPATDAEFLKVWTSCEDTAQVASRLGMTVCGVGNRARRMREQGIEVPRQEVAP